MVGEKLSKNEFSTKNQHSLANSKMHKYNICPECGSEKIIKYGIQNNKKSIKQKYLCKNCSKTFFKTIKKIKKEINIPRWAKLAYTEYIKYGLKINDIINKYKKDYKTIIKYFKLITDDNYKEHLRYNNVSVSPLPEQVLPQQHSIILSLDGTFFK